MLQFALIENEFEAKCSLDVLILSMLPNLVRCSYIDEQGLHVVIFRTS